MNRREFLPSRSLYSAESTAILQNAASTTFWRNLSWTPENKRGSPPHSPVVPDSPAQSSALGPGFLNYLQWSIHVCLYRMVSVWRRRCMLEPISLLLATREGCWLCLIACFRYLYFFIILLAKRWRCRRISEGSSELADLVTEGPETVPVAS